MTKLKNLNLTQLKNNQIVASDSIQDVFYSYNTLIAVNTKKSNKLTLTESWDYSQTTRRYLYEFISRFTTHNITCKKEVLTAIKNGVVNVK